MTPLVKNTNYLKQAIVVRKDLCMPAGKLGAMVGHAAMSFLAAKLRDAAPDQYDPPYLAIDQLSPDQVRWLSEKDPGLDDQVSMAKIVLAVADAAELLAVEAAAKAAGLTCHRVVDCGYSHNKAGDLACIAIGPHWPEQLQPVTGKLKIYR